ncbi:response regulator transcription factor [Thalassotalea atypica]|uniref:response regulator transcription factor n=1 Tax=Thalassotalea atypica TaxID=2054316 RepID=UPI0025725650|nr:response regulator transcription factor [Thalassotalea atypica]
MLKKQLLILCLDAEGEIPYADFIAGYEHDVHLCQTPVEAFYTLKSQQIDLIIIDNNKSMHDYIDLLVHLVNISTSPVMVFSQELNTIDHINVLEAGADDYVLKTAPVREMIARINVCLRRAKATDSHRPHKRLELNGFSLCMSSREVKCNDIKIAITGLEFELLYLLMSNAGDIVSRGAIGKCVFKRNISYCNRSLNMHVSNLRKKLKEVSDSSSIKTVRGAGYVFL